MINLNQDQLRIVPYSLTKLLHFLIILPLYYMKNPIMNVILSLKINNYYFINILVFTKLIDFPWFQDY